MFRLISSLLFLSILASHLWGNMRGPMHVYHPASRSMIRSSGSLEVMSESIHFICPDFESYSSSEPLPNIQCRVNVVYKVESKEYYKKLDLVFVSPNSEDMSLAVVSQNQQKVEWKQKKKKEIQMGSKNSNPYPSRWDPNLKYWENTFNGSIPPGKSEILVQYKQKLSLFEYGYGYFSDGNWKMDVDYYVWPIREWKLSNKFYIDFSMEIQKSNPKFFKKLFRNDLTLNCGVMLFGENLPPWLKTETQLREFYSKQIGKNQSYRNENTSPNEDYGNKGESLNMKSLVTKKSETDELLVYEARIEQPVPDAFGCTYYR